PLLPRGLQSGTAPARPDRRGQRTPLDVRSGARGEPESGGGLASAAHLRLLPRRALARLAARLLFWWGPAPSEDCGIGPAGALDGRAEERAGICVTRERRFASRRARHACRVADRVARATERLGRSAVGFAAAGRQEIRAALQLNRPPPALCPRPTDGCRL